jgi:Cys-tRNA(Pro)/Cys-tRNA(Cys) deacylase
MARRREATAGTPATTALTRAGIPFGVHPYEHDPAAPSYGLEAAEALGVPAEQVFKTLLVEGERGLAVGVVPVSQTLDLKAVASALGVKKVGMARPEDAERSSGYVVGGISPVGQKRALPTVVDESALAFPRVYVSGGRRGLDLSLSPADLVRVTSATTAAIAR